MKRTLLAAVGLGLSGWGAAAVQPATDAERQNWVNHLMPLPHEISITQSAVLNPADVGLAIAADAGPVQAQIKDELTALFQDAAGVAPTGAAFRIVLGVLDGQGRLAGSALAGAERLQACPNKNQAYIIRPNGDDCLAVAALHEKGLYYGAQTLRQLLSAGIFTNGSVRIPLAEVTDWPDMEERGIWNAARAVPFLAGLKLNFMTYMCGHEASSNAWHRPKVDPTMMDLLRRHAMVERVQMIHHLNYFDRLFGIYKAHPELMGQGAAAVCEGEQYKYSKRDIPVICASQPLWKTIIADMLAALGEQGAPEVSVWLSEFKGQCQCPQCRDSSQTLLESRLVADAWSSIRGKYPDMILRIFYSQGDGSPATDQALRELPPEVRIERVYSIYKPFLDAAQRGQWVLSFSGYDCIAGPDNSFRTPERIIPRITNGYAAKLKGVLSCSYHYYGEGMLPPEYYRQVHGFPASALAEWSWNVNGRTPRQFTEAWAARAGYAEPARFADWMEAISRLKTALEKPRQPGAGLPKTKGFKNQFAEIGAIIRNRDAFGLFDIDTLDKADALCREALALAEPLSPPMPALETRYFAALVKSYRCLNELSDSMAPDDKTKNIDAARVKEAWANYQAAVEEALACNDRRIELWLADPADYVEKAQGEISGQWLAVRNAMDEAITEIIIKEAR